MRPRLVLTALALALAACPALPAGAAEDPRGVPCTLAGTADPTTEAGVGTATISGGPVATADTAAFTLVCTAQVGSRHSDPDLASASAHGTAPVVAPTLVSFAAEGTVYVCTSAVHDDGDVRYFDAATETWGTDPTTASCADSGYVAPPPPPDLPVVYGAVLGMIQIERLTDAAPSVQLFGYVGDPDLFTCTTSAFDPMQPFSVTCVPAPAAPVTFYCAVLHANALAGSATGRIRTGLDCDGGVPEAVTRTASGPGDLDVRWAASNVAVTAFTCTVDDGAGHAPPAAVTGGCGDPGAAHL